MIVKSSKEFQNEVFRHLSFQGEEIDNYTLYKDVNHPENGFCIQYEKRDYYVLGIADYTIPEDFNITFDNPYPMLRFGTVYKGTTTFRLEGRPIANFTPSSFLVFEKDLKGKQVWKKGQHYHGVEITIHEKYMEEIKEHYPNVLELSNLILNYTYNSLPLEIVTILQKLQSLALNNKLTNIYLDSLLLECIAILSNELHSTYDNTFNRQLYYGVVTIGKDRMINLSNNDIQSIKKAHNILTDNPYAPPTIEHLSKLVTLNQQKLKAGFYLYYHMSIGEYTNTLRMSTAENLLLTTELSIEDISEKIGYQYSSNFTKMFKKTYGQTPLQYRKLKRDNLYL